MNWKDFLPQFTLVVTPYFFLFSSSQLFKGYRADPEPATFDKAAERRVRFLPQKVLQSGPVCKARVNPTQGQGQIQLKRIHSCKL